MKTEMLNKLKEKKLEYIQYQKDKIEKRLLRSKLQNTFKLYSSNFCSDANKKKDRLDYIGVKAV